MKTEHVRQLRHTDLFLPPQLESGDDPETHPIERATHLDGNIRLVLRSRMTARGGTVRAQMDWTLADVTRAIKMLSFIASQLGSSLDEGGRP